MAQTFAVFMRVPRPEELLVVKMVKKRSSCAVFSSPVSLLSDLFFGMMEYVSGDAH